MTKLYVLSGPVREKSFDLEGDRIFVGRSSDNDIQIKDKAVSRRHLKMVRKGNSYFITDLQSENGTIFKGDYLVPGIETEIREDDPIIIGTSVFCISKACLANAMKFLDSIELPGDVGEENRLAIQHRIKSDQKTLAFINRASDVLMEKMDIDMKLKKILDQIFEHLKRIDRVAFIIIDPETKETRDIISKFKVTSFKEDTDFCKDAVNWVLQYEKPLLISDTNVYDEDDLAETLKLLRIGSVLCVPLTSRSQVLGFIYIDSIDKTHGFRKDDLSLFIDLGKRTASAIEHARFISE